MSYSYPASYPSIMSVAATDINNAKAWFSQYNDEIDTIVSVRSALESRVVGAARMLSIRHSRTHASTATTTNGSRRMLP